MKRIRLKPKQKCEIKKLIKQITDKTLGTTQDLEALAQTIAEMSAFIALNKAYGEFQRFREVVYAD